jgi:hypothetical protein
MKPSRDLRQYANQTNIRLILGALVLIFVVGVGLIYLFYGSEAAMLGILCIGLGLVPLIFIGLLLFGLDWIVRRDRGE